MTKGLQKYFPMIRSRVEVLNDIQSHPNLSAAFYSWKKDYQEDFLDFCTGVRGIKLLYDSFFKEIINPESTPERLEEFLSLILQQRVKLRTVLPNDSSRIADESSLLILDILVELEDGSLANLEVQKVGYSFPGQRSACYSADLLLRQYKRVRSEKKNHFKYKDIKKVYTIVLIEHSSKEFHAFPNDYIHRSKQIADTGLQIDLLQEYIFIPIDIFLKNRHNNSIKNDLEAWLTFLGVDDPESIEYLIRQHPRFISMYQDVYEMCNNTERVMSLFSKELQILDRNTVQFMIDEMGDEIKDLKDTKQQLEDENQKLKDINQKFKDVNQKLVLQNQKLEDNYQNLECRAEKQAGEIESLKEDIARLRVQMHADRSHE